MSKEKQLAPVAENPSTPTRVNNHFVLSVVAVVLSCFTGFFAVPLAIAALILSLRTQDLLHDNRVDEAKSIGLWAGVFGWLTVAIVLIPILAVIFFGGAILAFITAVLATA